LPAKKVFAVEAKAIAHRVRHAANDHLGAVSRPLTARMMRLLCSGVSFTAAVRLSQKASFPAKMMSNSTVEANAGILAWWSFWREQRKASFECVQ